MASSIGRYLVVYDGVTEEVQKLHELEKFNLSDFSLALDVPDTDPEMYERYAIGPDDVKFLEDKIESRVNFDFTRFGYFVEAIMKDN